MLVDGDLDLSGHAKTLDPPPLKKWAEEGYAVAQLRVTSSGQPRDVWQNVLTCLSRLEGLPTCEWKPGNVGLISMLKPAVLGRFVWVCSSHT